MTAESIARGLHGRRSGGRWIAKCPAHNDRSPSLSIRDVEGKVLVKCFAGCDQAGVVTALKARGLWPERLRQEWTPEQRRAWGRRHRVAEAEAERLTVWRLWALELLRAWRNLFWKSAIRAENWLRSPEGRRLLRDEQEAASPQKGGRP